MNKFEIPYNFDKQLINYLSMLQIHNKIHSIYLPPFKDDYISAKHFHTHAYGQNVLNSFPLNKQEYESHINLINNYFPNTLMLLLQQNNTLIDEQLLDYYYNLGFHKFCVGSYEQAKIIRNKFPYCEIIGSITMKIMPKDLTDNKYKIFDGFVLWFPFNRNLPEIKKLPKNYKYTLLVNCDCSIYCDGTRHWLATSQKNDQNSGNYCPRLHCSEEFKDIIRIKAEDLILFENYISYFKLQGREYKTVDLISDICIYLNYNQYSIQNNENLYYNKSTDNVFKGVD